ncbi:hypothetical protein ZIOFF_052861 [Zingiber officinale]|uniref:Uncharacterized protein n=1 Tax=Zingiber officinale TaxID=94328 RepID=A0A8J5FQJ4_ZINOF|nr:hypothetical protein ZIOFF_052861 [Zingiber officinale]
MPDGRETEWECGVTWNERRGSSARSGDRTQRRQPPWMRREKVAPLLLARSFPRVDSSSSFSSARLSTTTKAATQSPCSRIWPELSRFVAMDPCPFGRVLVGNLALKIPVSTRPAGAETATVPLVSPEESPSTLPTSLAARFNLSKADLNRIANKSSIFTVAAGSAKLRVAVYTGRRGTTCGISSGRLLGEVTVTLDLKRAYYRGRREQGRCVPQRVGRHEQEEGGEGIVVACAVVSHVHDLSGSPVALASMLTPFVASPGTDRVSRSNPGAWLVLRPGYGVWKPWGRPEAWRERGGSGSGDGLGYRFELLAKTAMGAGINLAESTLSATKGRKFTIDLTAAAGTPLSRSISPGCSPRGSRDFGYAKWPFSSYRGFVMSSTVAGEGRGGRSTLEVVVEHVGCTEDAAALVALAAAIDLSMDACRLFSHKLRRELSWPDLLGW